MHAIIYYYWYYSGILLIIYTWCFLAFPYLVGARNSKNKGKATFSDIAALPKYKILMSPALVLIGLTQVFFLDLMLQKFQITLWPNGTLYLLSSFNLVISAFCDSIHFSEIHKIASGLYFLSSSIGAFILSFDINLVALVIMASLVVGFFYYTLRKEYVWAELYFSLLSSLWAISVYLTV